MEKIEGKNIVVWFSAGAASAVAAKIAVDKYGEANNVVLVNNPVKEEDSDNLRFIDDVSNWTNREVFSATNSEAGTISARDIWEKRKYMSGPQGAPCTMILKKGARYEYEKKHEIDFHILGFTSNEEDRHNRFTSFERSNVLPVLIDDKLTKTLCFDKITEAGINLPRTYIQGYPNANCIGCVKSSSPTYWNHVRKMHPDVFEDRAEQSRDIGCKLVKVKKKRIFLDELKTTDIGGKMKSYECGIFCDTN